MTTTETATSADPGLDSEYRALRRRARLLSTNRPGILYGVAVVEAALFVAGGTVIAANHKVLAGVFIGVIGLLVSSMAFIPARWSQRHPEEARRAVDIMRAKRNRLARRHPAYFLVVIPLILAGDAALRWNSGSHHHHSVWTWTVPAGLGLVFGVGLGALIVYRARHTSGSWTRTQASR